MIGWLKSLFAPRYPLPPAEQQYDSRDYEHAGSVAWIDEDGVMQCYPLPVGFPLDLLIAMYRGADELYVDRMDFPDELVIARARGHQELIDVALERDPRVNRIRMSRYPMFSQEEIDEAEEYLSQHDVDELLGWVHGADSQAHVADLQPAEPPYSEFALRPSAISYGELSDLVRRSRRRSDV